MRLVPALVLAGALAATAAAAEPRIRDLSIVVDGARVLSSFRLEDGFTPEVRERLESGLPTGFTYRLELARDRKRWWDAGLDSKRFEVIAMFNAVAREYLVNTKLDGKLIDSRTLRETSEVEAAMTRFTNLPAFELEPTGGRERYLIRARVEFGTGHLLGFIPYLRTSSWTDSNKVRVTAP